MFIYIFNFFLIAFGSIIPTKDNFKNYNQLYWNFLIIYLIVFVGFRYEVGGDWLQYLYLFQNIQILPITQFNFKLTDLAYLILLKISILINANIILVNLITSVICFYSIKVFCETQKDKYISLLILYPYFITVVIMGYVRQGIAASIILLALVFFLKRKIYLLILSLVIASLFHKSAIFSFFLLLIYPEKLNRRKFTLIVLLLTILILIFYYFFLYQSINRIIYYFIYNISFDSKGAYLRIIYFIPPIFILFFFKDKIIINKFEKRLYYSSSIIILILMPLIYWFSTLIDRVLIYFVFLQVYISLKFYELLTRRFHIIIFCLFLICFYLTYLVMWFNFSRYSIWWSNYNFNINIFKYINFVFNH